jgi:hypothetical protein
MSARNVNRSSGRNEAHRAGFAFRSGSPTDLALAGDADRWAFTGAQPTRCNRHCRGRAPGGQGAPKQASRNLRTFLSGQRYLAPFATCSREGRTSSSPSRERFRPPPRLTVRFRVVPPGEASTYSRPVLGAGGNLRWKGGRDQGPGSRIRAQIANVWGLFGSTCSHRPSRTCRWGYEQRQESPARERSSGVRLIDLDLPTAYGRPSI